MPTSYEYLERAASQIGDYSYDNPYNTWYYGHEISDPDENWAHWCAVYQSWVAQGLGGCGFNSSASCVDIYDQLPHVADADVQPGDFVFYRWDGSQDTSWFSHIGVVEAWDGNGWFTTIEGNCNDGVRRCRRYNGSSYATHFARPSFDVGAGGKDNPDPLDYNYRVHTQEDGWLPAVHRLDDFAGVYGHAIDCLAVLPQAGHHTDIKVHHLGDDWGTEVSSDRYDLDTYETGYAGTVGTPADGVMAYANNDCKSGERAQYRVHVLGGDWLEWQFDHEQGDDEDGYAGIYGQAIDGFQIC
jgi:hypothetical protein